MSGLRLSATSRIQILSNVYGLYLDFAHYNMTSSECMAVSGRGTDTAIQYQCRLSQHGIASYVTKFESQSFRLHSKYGVAFAQRERCWRSQRSASASKSKSRGGPISGIVLGSGKWTAVLRICKLLHWKQRLADWTGSLSVKGKLVQAASFWTFLCKRSCFMPAASLIKLDTTSHSWLVLLKTQSVTGYRRVCLSHAAHRKVCWLTRSTRSLGLPKHVKIMGVLECKIVSYARGPNKKSSAHEVFFEEFT